jgi:hypothetical protein
VVVEADCRLCRPERHTRIAKKIGIIDDMTPIATGDQDRPAPATMPLSSLLTCATVA